MKNRVRCYESLGFEIYGRLIVRADGSPQSARFNTIKRQFSPIAGTKVDFTLPRIGENEEIDEFAGASNASFPGRENSCLPSPLGS